MGDRASDDEVADSLALLADSVLTWGGGDASEFWALVASGIDLAPAKVRIGWWRRWLQRALR